MTPILTVTLFFWMMVLASSLTFISDRSLRVMLRTRWKLLAILLLATAIWRIPANGIFFHGLEYEDSYIYTVAGRQIAERVAPPASAETPFSISACQVGSLKACQEWTSFPEHFLGYPYAIGEFSRVFGYTASVGSIINLVSCFISVFLVFSITLSITDDSMAASLAGFAFAVIPVFAVYGLETSAEPFSNLCILITIWAYLRFWNTDHNTIMGWPVYWVAYSAALLFSQTVKRENILLALVLPAMIRFARSETQPTSLMRNLKIGAVLLTSGLALILSSKMHLLQTSGGERELLHQFPLTSYRLAEFVGVFFSSFLVTSWYGGTFLVVAVGVGVTCLVRGRAVLPVVLLSAYILLYASHIRSYYEMESGQIAPGAALRFSMNFMGLWAIVAGIGLGVIVKRVRQSVVRLPGMRGLMWATVAVSTGALTASFIATIHLRDEKVEDESISRLTPAAMAARSANHDVGPSDFVVTMEPLVIQMYSGPQTRIVDLESVSAQTLTALAQSETQLILLRESDRLAGVDLNRYGDPIRYILSLPSETLISGDGFVIDQIKAVK